jgi:hypothetical protein
LQRRSFPPIAKAKQFEELPPDPKLPLGVFKLEIAVQDEPFHDSDSTKISLGGETNPPKAKASCLWSCLLPIF